MNKDILKGIKLETTGMVKQTWGMLTGNDLEEIEGRREKLLGRLQKKYGSIKEKAELEYHDSIELAEIVSRIREIMNMQNDATAIAFIARYGKPLLAKNQEPKITEKKNQRGHDTDRYFDSRLSRRNTHPAI